MLTNAPSPNTGRPSPTVAWADGTGRISAETLDWLAEQMTASVAWLWARAGSHPRPTPDGGEVRVRVVGDAEMSAAHLRYAKVPGTTDVLTFDLSEGESGSRALDADIVVCVDEAERQARERGHDPRRELLLYAVHGLLHCLGHDDHDAASYERMHRLEDEVLTAIGVGAVFGASHGGGEP